MFYFVRLTDSLLSTKNLRKVVFQKDPKVCELYLRHKKAGYKRHEWNRGVFTKHFADAYSHSLAMKMRKEPGFTSNLGHIDCLLMREMAKVQQTNFIY